MMEDKIEIVHEEYTCGDGCCYENWISVFKNGVAIGYRCNPSGYVDVIQTILDSYGICATVEEIYEPDEVA